MTSLRPVDFGLPTDKSALAVRLGIERGIFAEEGIDLRIRVMFGGPLLAKAYDSGELEFGQMGSPPAVNALDAGARFRIVGGGLRRKAHMYLSVRADIADFAGLRGGRVGLLSMGSCDEWFCRVLFQWIVRIANNEAIERDPALVRAILGACCRAAHFASTHTDDWADFLMECYGLARDTAEAVIARELPHLHLDGNVDMDGIDAVIGIQRQLGAVTGPLAAADIVDLRFLEPGGLA